MVALAVVACGGRPPRAETGSNGAAGNTSADACTAGKQTYQRKRAEALHAAASGCERDTDCGLLYESNACLAGCGTPLLATAAEATAKQLSDVASNLCSSCSPMPIPPCAPPAPLKCVAGRCSEAP